nr:hypothetical protein NeseNPV-TR_ORF4 [Neodiprion sertifer nucleopolyhedrovirus]
MKIVQYYTNMYLQVFISHYPYLLYIKSTIDNLKTYQNRIEHNILSDLRGDD